ncbi:XRE family transcriptional regulator [Amaricoccus sp. W119]|uniref:XRE family transcriptional regulator n=1 Tax=Amaricoccus sp. W119 TaxID=3391833 RepID=UPI0039A5E191
MPDMAKPPTGFGSGVMELALQHRGDAYRVVFALRWVLHAFQKKSKTGIKTPRGRNRPDPRAAEAAERKATMSEDDFEVIRGSGNVFRDLGHADAAREQLRALLAARIVGVLDERGLTVRRAQEETGIAAADFSRIRRAKLGRFTIDRLMAILSGLGQEVEVTVNVHPRKTTRAAAEPRP